MRTLFLVSIGLFGGFWLGTTATYAADEELVIFDWSAYNDPGFYQGYIEQHGDEPTFSFFGEEEEAFQKLRIGFEADISHPCSQSVSKWHEAGLLDPLQIDRIERWDQVNETMKEAFKIDGEYYLLPADWGTTALAYRADLVPEEDIQSLQVFVDPKYAGKVSIADNVDDAYALAYLATGVSDWTSVTESDLEKASAWLREAHKNVRDYWQDGAGLSQLMASGEVLIAWAWNETPVVMQSEGHDVRMNRLTREGSSTWFCGYVDLANGPNDDSKVYDFFNAWFEPRSVEYIVNEWGYGHGNQAEMDKLGSEILVEMGLGPINVPVLAQKPMNHEIREQMIAEFELIKAGF